MMMTDDVDGDDGGDGDDDDKFILHTKFLSVSENRIIGVLQYPHALRQNRHCKYGYIDVITLHQYRKATVKVSRPAELDPLTL